MFDSRIINLDTVGTIITLGESVHRGYVNRGGCLWIWPYYRGMVITYRVVRRTSFATSSQAYFRQSLGVFLTLPLNFRGWRTLPLAGLLTSTMVQTSSYNFTTKYQPNTSIRDQFNHILSFQKGFNSSSNFTTIIPVQNCYHILAFYLEHLTRFTSINRFNHIINMKEHSHLSTNSYWIVKFLSGLLFSSLTGTSHH